MNTKTLILAVLCCAASLSTPTGAQAASCAAPSAAASYKAVTAPEYPVEARLHGREGRVLLDVELDATGAIDRIEVSSRSVDPALAAAAKDSVRRWSFEPALRCGVPVASRVSVPVRFMLSQLDATAFVDCTSC
jgi:protein TonB